MGKKNNVSNMASTRISNETLEWILTESKRLKMSKSAFINLQLEQLCKRKICLVDGKENDHRDHQLIPTLSLSTSPLKAESITVNWGVRKR